MAAKAPATPLPRRPLAAVLAVQFCEAFQINILFPFVVFMVRDFHVVQREEDVGRLAGVLAASFSVAQFISNFFWGSLSDRIGRKRALLLGVAGTSIATAVFGTSTTFTQAMAGRFLSGLLSGNVCILKSFLADVTDASNRTRAFSLLPLAWGAGCIAGPVVGGLLARPAIQYPNLPWGPFVTFPYLLPCVCAVLIQGAAAVMVVWLMADCRPVHPPPTDTGPKPTIPVEWEPLGAIPDSDVVELLSVGGPRCQDEVDDEPRGHDPVPDPLHQVAPTVSLQKAFRPKKPRILFGRKPVVTTVVYMLLALFSIAYDEILPVLMATPSSLGGLGMESSSIGLTLMVAGVAQFAATLTVTPWLLTHIRLLTALRVYWLCVIPLTLGYPHIHLLGGSPTLAWAALQGLISLQQQLDGLSFTAVFIMVNNSCPSASLGAVNGMAQSLSALARAVGPALAGAVWSASIDPALAAWFPLGHATLFVLLGSIGLLDLGLSYLVPADIQHSVDEHCRLVEISPQPGGVMPG